MTPAVLNLPVVTVFHPLKVRVIPVVRKKSADSAIPAAVWKNRLTHCFKSVRYEIGVVSVIDHLTDDSAGPGS